jgi:hypothetical protein
VAHGRAHRPLCSPPPRAAHVTRMAGQPARPANPAEVYCLGSRGRRGPWPGTGPSQVRILGDIPAPAGVEPARIGSEVPADLVRSRRDGRVSDGDLLPAFAAWPASPAWPISRAMRMRPCRCSRRRSLACTRWAPYRPLLMGGVDLRWPAKAHVGSHPPQCELQNGLIPSPPLVLGALTDDRHAHPLSGDVKSCPVRERDSMPGWPGRLRPRGVVIPGLAPRHRWRRIDELSSD